MDGVELEDALKGVRSPAIRPALRRCLDSGCPANVGLMQLLMAAHTEGEARQALEGIRTALENSGSKAAARARQVVDLWDRIPAAYATIKSVMAAEPATQLASSANTIDQIARTFDCAAHASPEASVALYALGSPELFAQTSSEVMGRLRDWGLLAADSVVLDLGCGIGRLLECLASEVRLVLGVDISMRMLAAARRRCGGRPDVGLIRSSGYDLAAVASGSIDLVCASDSFPYLVPLGPAVVKQLFFEATRVLKPGGSLIVLNFSYRGDICRDRADIVQLAADCGLAIKRNGTFEFTLWDASTFHLVTP